MRPITTSTTRRRGCLEIEKLIALTSFGLAVVLPGGFLLHRESEPDPVQARMNTIVEASLQRTAKRTVSSAIQQHADTTIAESDLIELPNPDPTRPRQVVTRQWLRGSDEIPASETDGTKETSSDVR